MATGGGDSAGRRQSSDLVRCETLAVHAGERRPGPEGSVVFPIFQSTVFTDGAAAGYHDLTYIRLSTTPTQAYVHDKLAALERADAAVATASGMAAISSTLLGFLRPGDHVLVSRWLYGGTEEIFAEYAERFGWDVTRFDPCDVSTWGSAWRAETRLVFVESIANPLMRVARLGNLISDAKAHGVLVVVDNTFASPVNLRPLVLGADLCVHSATKYLGGHSDVAAGCVCGRRDLVAQVRRTVNLLGGALDPHAAFLLARGIKTLALRVRQQNACALALAEFLATHADVAEVHYPGLPGHRDHTHAAAFLGGFGGVLSFSLRGGSPAAESLLSALELASVAPSLGGVETLAVRPATTTHATLPALERAARGISDDLIRVSCGIEDPRDVVADFEQALVRSARRHPAAAPSRP